MKRAVLLMAYGSPSGLDDVERYYTHIRRGVPPEPAQLQALLDRYMAIGGSSPLISITNAQARLLGERLEKLPQQYFSKVYTGLKHTEPFITHALEQMAADGVQTAVGIVLAPHYSALSVGVYMQEAAKKADELGISMKFINDWYAQPALNEALTIRLQDALARLQGVEKVKVVFSAHSLPERVIAMNDPYPSQLQRHSDMLATRVGVEDWQFAWQSAARTREAWLGPDILHVLQDLKMQGYDGVVSCPLGFIADHLEVLYDLDVEAKRLSQQLGLRFARTDSLNDDPLLIEALFQAINE